MNGSPATASRMTAAHALLGLLVAALWGVNFVAARIALNHVTPLLLVALRFGVAAIPALVIPRPAITWSRMAAIASTLFVGQFTFLFWGLQVGMTAGVASVVTQAQAIFTAILAGLVLRETQAIRTWAGLFVAMTGLVLIGATVGAAGVSVVGLFLTLLAAASWAAGNILLRGCGRVDRLALIVWLSLLPPVPMLLLSLVIDGPGALREACQGDIWQTLVAILYIAFAATLGGYGLWGYLLKLYPAGAVAPFALLVPPFGLAAAWFGLGEQFGALRLAGIVLVCAGLAIGALPLPDWLRLVRSH